MNDHGLNYYLKNIKSDLMAGVVVFLVALPLCLGIALASGAPPFSGVIGAAVGGLVVSVASGSQLSVSGPANGVTIIAASIIADLGYPGLLLAVSIAGIIQIILGFIRAGVISAYFPSAVIRGMLASIGLMLILKQIPHAIGYDIITEDDMSFLEESSKAEISIIQQALSAVSPGAIILSISSIALMILWETNFIKSNKLLSLIPAPLIIILYGVIFSIIIPMLSPLLALSQDHFVNLPSFQSVSHFWEQAVFPDFSLISNPQIFIAAFTLAMIASLESLLSLEAADKLDPLKRTAPTDRELKAQGLGNVLSGLIGGLPISAVIVRTSVNINAGGKTKMSSFVHGVCMIISAIFFVKYINLIPLACLAAILIVTGFKLTKPKIYVDLFKQGSDQFLPFIITIVAMNTLDSLRGVMIGLATGLLFVSKNNYHQAFSLTQNDNNYLLRLKKDVSFLHKAPLRQALNNIPENSFLLIDGSRASFIDRDIVETINDFVAAGTDSNIVVELKDVTYRQSHE